jgi:phosphatidylglycerophosphate synthase
MPDASPHRPSIARFYRAPLERFERHVPLPRVAPAWYSAASLVLSAMVWLVLPDSPFVAVLVAGALVADWLDGATARRYALASPNGYLTDVVVDRVSEGLIFAPLAITALHGGLFGQVFLGLWVVNCALAVYSVRSGRHRILPLRFVYLVALVIVWLYVLLVIHPLPEGSND